MATKSPTRAGREAPRSAVVEARIDAARETCRAAGLRLTEVREWVLRELLTAHRAMTAYELIGRLSVETGRAVGPPTVYRALEFLDEQGFVDRLLSQNAYVACAGPSHGPGTIFFVCQACGGASEVSDKRLARLVADKADALGFAATRPILEVEGRCRACGG